MLSEDGFKSVLLNDGCSEFLIQELFIHMDKGEAFDKLAEIDMEGLKDAYVNDVDFNTYFESMLRVNSNLRFIYFDDLYHCYCDNYEESGI